MKYPTYTIWFAACTKFSLLFVGILANCLGSAIVEGQVPPRRTDTYLLLKNGGLMRGQVVPTPSGFEVVSGSGSRYQMTRAQVVAHFTSIEEVFGYKFLQAKKKNLGSVYSELVYWCVQEKLFDEAEQVIESLSVRRYSDRGNPRASNESRDRMTKDRDRLKNYVLSARRRLVQNGANTLQPKSAVKRPANLDPAVRTVSWNSETDGKAGILRPKRDPEYLPTIQEMDEVTKEMPKSGNRIFRKLQVSLSAGCLAAKCHSRTTDSFQLLETRRGQKADWRTTQKNLFFALKFADRSDPDRSLLLKKMSTQHGGQTQPAYPTDSDTYQMMRAWLFYVTGQSALLQRRLIQPQQAPTPGSNPKPPAAKENNRDASTAAMNPELLTPPDPERLFKKPSRLARDPFDPEIFNRQHHPDRKTTAVNQRK